MRKHSAKRTFSLELTSSTPHSQFSILMTLSSITLTSFRSSPLPQTVEFSDGVNILYGKNASGKTNLLEAIYLCAAGKSFRACDEKNFIRHGERRCGVLAEYSAEDGRQSSVEVCYYTDGKSLSRMFRLDGVKTDSASEAVGNLRAVVFTPDHLSIVKGAPEERRRFLDMVMSQASRSYIKYLSAYNKRLRYKNDFLRIAKVKGISPDPVMLETVNITLAEYAVRVCDMRREFCRELTKHASEIYSKLTDGRESLKLEYVSKISLPEGLDFEESVSEVCRIFGEAAESEIAAGYSVVGPHRDDISMRISVGGEKNENYSVGENSGKDDDTFYENELGEAIPHSAKYFGSRGQQRSAVLSLKLAEGEMLKKLTGEYPVFLLDDVLSELDSGRRSFILSKLSGRQVIVTCCDADTAFSNIPGARFIKADGGVYEDYGGVLF